MKRSFILMLGVICLMFLGCAPKMETTKTPMPQSKNRGSLRINLKTAKGMEIEPEDVSRMKKLLKEKFTLAGYRTVSISRSNSKKNTTIDMLITKYEHEHNTNTGSAAVGGGCVYLCPLFAPILLARGYHRPQFEIVAEVSVYRNSRKVADKIMSEKSVSSANLVNAGDAEFRAQLEDMTIHNFTVSLLKVLESS